MSIQFNFARIKINNVNSSEYAVVLFWIASSIFKGSPRKCIQEQIENTNNNEKFKNSAKVLPINIYWRWILTLKLL